MSPGLTDSLTGSLTLPAAGRWNTDPMDTRTQQPPYGAGCFLS